MFNVSLRGALAPRSLVNSLRDGIDRHDRELDG